MVNELTHQNNLWVHMNSYTFDSNIFLTQFREYSYGFPG